MTHFLFDSWRIFIEFWSLEYWWTSLFVGALISCALITWLHSSTLPKFINPLLSPNPSSPHYNSCNVLLIIICTLPLSGGEFVNLSKHMVVCIIRMSFEWIYAIIQMHNQEWSTFPKSELLPVYLVIQFLVLAYCDLWLFRDYQVWCWACGRIFLWKHSPCPDFKTSSALLAVAID